MPRYHQPSRPTAALSNRGLVLGLVLWLVTVLRINLLSAFFVGHNLRDESAEKDRAKSYCSNFLFLPLDVVRVGYQMAVALDLGF